MGDHPWQYRDLKIVEGCAGIAIIGMYLAVIAAFSEQRILE